MKQLSEMTTSELIDYWTGYLLVAIGQGKFREAVGTMLISTLSEASSREAEKKARKRDG